MNSYKRDPSRKIPLVCEKKRHWYVSKPGVKLIKSYKRQSQQEALVYQVELQDTNPQYSRIC